MGLLTTLDSLFGKAYDAVESAIEKIDKKVSKVPKQLKKLRRRIATSNEVRSRDVVDGRSRCLPETGARPKYLCNSETKKDFRDDEERLAQHDATIITTDTQPSPDHKLDLASNALKKHHNEFEQRHVEVSKSSHFDVSTSTCREREEEHPSHPRVNDSSYPNIRTGACSASTSTSTTEMSGYSLTLSTALTSFQAEARTAGDQDETCIVASSRFEFNFPPIYPTEETIPCDALYPYSHRNEISPSSQSQREDFETHENRIPQSISQGNNVSHRKVEVSYHMHRVAASRVEREPHGSSHSRSTETKFTVSERNNEIYALSDETDSGACAGSGFDWQDEEEKNTGREAAVNRELVEIDALSDDVNYEACAAADIDWRDEKGSYTGNEYDVNNELVEIDAVSDEADYQACTAPDFDWSDEKGCYTGSGDDVNRERVEIDAMSDEADCKAYAAYDFDWRNERGRNTSSEDSMSTELVEIPIVELPFYNSVAIDAHSQTGECKRGSTYNDAEKVQLAHGKEPKSMSRTLPHKINSVWPPTAEESIKIIKTSEKRRKFGKFDRGSWCLWAVPKKSHSCVLVYACEHRYQEEQIWRNGFPYPDKKDQSYWYHGTSIRSALNIIRNGIQLERGQVRQDFSHGDGFYLSPCLQNARNWTCNVRGYEPAVVVFKIAFNLQSYLSLDISSSLHEWQSIIRFNRSGRRVELDGDLLDRFESCDYVFGPINGGKTGSKCVDGNWLQWKPSGFKNSFRQL